jgi:hypothetical protein
MLEPNNPRRGLCAVLLASFGCGPGGFASDGGDFGDGTDTVGTSDSASGSASVSVSSGDGDGDGDPAGSTTETETETETESGNDSWTDPETETETETETGEPEPAPTCTRIWTHIDTQPSHGHIGATPMVGRPEGGFVTVNPVIGAGNDDVNVDAWFRSWSSDGSVEWERLVSWGDHRDDPLVLLHDDLGDLFAAGRINANQQIEEAMVAALDGLGGELLWTFLRGEGGGYTSLVHNGVALLAAGQIGEFGSRRLELVAFVPDNGEQLWSSAPELGMNDVVTRGLVMADGVIDVLVADTGQFGDLKILRFEPPTDEPELLVSLSDDGGVVPSDLERFGPDMLAALYSVGPSSYLSLVTRDDGELVATLAFDDLGLGLDVAATELVETPGGLAVAGTLEDVSNEAKTFIVQLDEQLEVLCVGGFGEADIGIFNPPELRGLSVGPEGELITASYVSDSRVSVLARWE